MTTVPTALRLFLAAIALAAGIGPWWASRDHGTQSFPGFIVENQTDGAPPFFRTETINTGSSHAKSHSATLAELSDGTLAAAWYAGSGEGASDVAIYLAKRSADGAWKQPATLCCSPMTAGVSNCFLFPSPRDVGPGVRSIWRGRMTGEPLGALPAVSR
jgi:hypothetical protein